MKKNSIALGKLIALIFLFFTGCQKDTKLNEETTFVNGNSLQAITSQKNQECQLTHFSVEGFDNRFHYNNNGLTDEWRIDYGDGIPDVFTMQYNANNQLSKAWLHYDGQLLATINFVWNRNLITEEHWDYLGYLFDVENIYDRKGQMIKREFSDGYSVATTFSPNGNTPRVDLLYDGELFLKLDFTYNQPNKNPFLAIRGIPYGFPFIAFTFSNWWETSEKQTVYENGVPSVVLDMDPAQTVMQLGFQNYSTSITAYDRIGNSYYHYGFEFQNCGPNETANSAILPGKDKGINLNSKKARLMKAMMSHGRQLREGLLEIKNKGINKSN
ncbi:MAG: hypothetical protein ABIT96_11005 [Ferruginibacter sp.]